MNFIILTYFLSYRQSLCHTEALAEVSINLKCDFSALRHILNSVDFSPFTKAQNDNGDFFAAATPCNPLGRFVLTRYAQNDKGVSSLQVDFRCVLCLTSHLLAFFVKAQNVKIHKQRRLLRLWIATQNSLMLFLLAMHGLIRFISLNQCKKVC